MGWWGIPTYASMSPPFVQPRRSKNATLANWIWATIFLPPKAPAVATAKRTSGSPTPRARNSGSTANRSPCHTSPVPRGNSRTVPAAMPAHRPSTRMTPGRAVVVVTVSRVEQVLLLDEDLVADPVVAVQLHGA